DPAVDAADGNLGPVAGLARHALDLDGTVLDLRNFALEESLHEKRTGPGEDYLDAMADLLDVEDEGADLLAVVVLLAADLLPARQDGLGLADRDDGRPAFHALHDAGLVQQLILEPGQVDEQALALLLAEELDHLLLGGLGGDPAQGSRE